jgi:hypothetical protein
MTPIARSNSDQGIAITIYRAYADPSRTSIEYGAGGWAFSLSDITKKPVKPLWREPMRSVNIFPSREARLS